LQTSQGYIFRILQHFATKLWNITNFVMLFQAVMKFLLRSKFSLLRKWSIIRVRKLMLILGIPCHAIGTQPAVNMYPALLWIFWLADLFLTAKFGRASGYRMFQENDLRCPSGQRSPDQTRRKVVMYCHGDIPNSNKIN
jgi:hypothetical protein